MLGIAETGIRFASGEPTVRLAARYADGVNIHALLMPRAEFRKMVAGLNGSGLRVVVADDSNGIIAALTAITSRMTVRRFLSQAS